MTHLHPLLRILWPDDFDQSQRVYALLDGARDPAIHVALLRANLHRRCLFGGRLSPALSEVAPHLVQLEPHAPFTAMFLSQGWTQHWGVCLQSAANIDVLARHFRRLLRVRDERGNRLLFRFYDPRVLSQYLPTCTAAELATVFGPVNRFDADTVGAGRALRLQHAPPRLATRVVTA